MTRRRFGLRVSGTALVWAGVLPFLVAAEQTPPAPPAPAAPVIRPNTFPAQQRPPADPAVVERGRVVFAAACGSCHGADARGGQLNGPNLLRSVLVLTDQNAELIGPVIRQGRPGTAMVPIDMAPADVSAIAAFLHSLQGASRGQGMPPPGPPAEVNVIVGDASAGQAYFKEKCASCHSPTGDLAGIASRISDPRLLQAAWVAGGRGGSGSARRAVTATITPATGPAITGRLVRMDDFFVTVALGDGTIRTVRRDGAQPKVTVVDPLSAHRALLGQYTNKAMRDVSAYLVTLK